MAPDRDPGPAGICASRGVGYTHQKRKDSRKSERHPAEQATVSDG
jgi:hypothetical protein